MFWFYIRIIVIIVFGLIGFFTVYFVPILPISEQIILVKKFGIFDWLIAIFFLFALLIGIPLMGAITLRFQVQMGFFKGSWVRPGWKTNFLNIQDPLQHIYLGGFSLISFGLTRILTVFLKFRTIDLVGIFSLLSSMIIFLAVFFSLYINKDKYK